MSKIFVDQIEPKTTGGSITFPEPTTFSSAATFSAGLTGGGKLLNMGFSHYTTALNLTTSYQTINTVTMTPASATSKFICLVTATFYKGTTTTVNVTSLNRDGTFLYEAADWWNASGTGLPGNASLNYVDQPNTTNAVTWTQDVKEDVGGGATNKDYNGTNNGVCTLIVMEVA